jgi:hypothetical protein
MKRNSYRNIFYFLLPFLGTLFLLWYVKNATCDVVYSDYVRLVNSYLPDVWDPEKFFVPDVLTRLPINYLARIINVELFGFSITFERVLGVVSVGLAALVFARYCVSRSIGAVWFCLLMAVMFSLNQWEMLTNGSGWSHFFAVAGFFYNQVVLDRVWNGNPKKYDGIRLLLLPWLLILGTAGPYGGSYGAVMLSAYVFCFLYGRKRKDDSQKEWGRRYVFCFLSTLLPLLLYLLSNSFAVESHAGATGRSLTVILSEDPSFFPRFILKSLAGMVIGGEELLQWIQGGALPNSACYLLGGFVAAAYLLALWLHVRYTLYEKHLLPLMLLIGGGGNHLLIFLSRYIFEQEDYALSSRYALQFKVGILGILLTFAFVWGKTAINRFLKAAIGLFCLAILLGNGYTTYREIKKAPYREENFEKMARLAPEIPGMSDEALLEQKQELEDLYEYRKGIYDLRQAFRILEENNLNIFR